MLLFIKLMWIWLAVGFLTGIKIVYIDKTITKEILEDLAEKAETPSEMRTVNLLSNKKAVLAMCTLMGFIILYADLKEVFRELKTKLKTLFSRDKSKK